MRMKKFAVIILAILVAVSAVPFTAVAAEKPIEWIAQGCFPTSLPIGLFITKWAEKVEAMSGGRMKIQVHSEGEIVPGPAVFESVRDGVLDVGQNTPAWQKGQYPAGDLFYTLPGGVTETNDLLVWMYGGEGATLMQEMYGDIIKVFPLGLTPPESGIWSTKPVRTLEDFKGLKIRSAGLCMELLEQLGASVVLLAGGEVVPSLQRGVIDAAEFSVPSMDKGLGLNEVCKYLIGPPIHMGANMFQLMINKDKWAALPDDLKAIVEEAALAVTVERYAIDWVESLPAFESFKKQGIEFIKLSPEDQAKTFEMTVAILEKNAKGDKMFKKVWDSQKAFINSNQDFFNFTKFDR
jgi:TRAP-type mannitol/chloroaromatic compound transport system substrate-binding protein